MDKSRKVLAVIAMALAFAVDDCAWGRSLPRQGGPIASVCSASCGPTQTATPQQPRPGGAPDSKEARPSQQCSVNGLLPRPPAPRPHYALDVRVFRGLKTVEGALTVALSAPASGRTDRLVFRLWPNGPRYAKAGARLSVSRVREGAQTLHVAQPNPTTLVVSRRLAAGERVVVSMDWRLVLPRETGLRLKGGGRSIRLGSFFPLLAWDENDWALDPPTTLANAEAWTSPTADFDVRLTHPRALRALASGQQVRPDRWRAWAVRDFTLALGHFSVVRGIAH